MKNNIFKIIGIALSITPLSHAATIYVDGTSPELAWYSPRFKQDSTGFVASGIYWYDEQQGLGNPFQAYQDGSLGGGSYTLGVVSLDASPSPTISITSNTGTVSAPFGSSHTRNVAYLALDQDADILYEVRSGTTTIFLGSYFGRFDDQTPLFSSIIIDSAGLNGQLDSTFDFHRPDRNYDVSIFVRESTTAAPRVIPEPSTTLLIMSAGVIALGYRRRRQD